MSKELSGDRVAVIADVARLAGVSVPTVSRVLTGAAPVGADKLKRVLEAIETLNYRPNATARALASRSSSMISIITGDIARYGYAETIRGLERAARADGKFITITIVDSVAADKLDRTIGLVLDQRPAGIAVLKFDRPGAAALARIPAGRPVVAISGVRSRQWPQAVLDEMRSAETLTDHLLGLGHRTVHHVRIPPSRREDGRTRGWRKALQRAGIVEPAVHDASWHPESGRRIGVELADDPSVTAVFCGNDEIAMGVIRGLTDSGVQVPADISVVGFDDHPLAAIWTPGLTTVRQDFLGLGTRAYRLLMTPDADERFSTEVPQLVIRDSTAPPSARDNG